MLGNGPVRKSITGFNCLDVEVESEAAYRDDDTPDTVIRFINAASTNWSILVDGHEIKFPESVSILLRGNSEARTFLEAFKFLSSSLEGILDFNTLKLELWGSDADASQCNCEKDTGL